jgi:hypothetical protein
MKQPLTLRWKNARHYHTAMLTPDLFGGWVLVTSSGDCGEKNGRVHQKPLSSYEQGIEAVHRLRHRRRLEGYDFCGGAFTQLDARDVAVPRTANDALLRLFKAWDLDPAEQAALLGIDARTLGRLQDGCALPDEAILLERVKHLLAINKSLRLRFAGDPEALRAWLRRPCPALGEHSPLQAMLKSATALANLRDHLALESDKARGCGGNARAV